MKRNCFLKTISRLSRIIFFHVLVLLFFLVKTGYAQTVSQIQAEKNLKVFADLYGYIRFFHPSDLSEKTDWYKLSIYGCKSVLTAKNDAELAHKLNEVFINFLPNIKIQAHQVNLKKFSSELTPISTNNFSLIKYENLGLGLPYASTLYSSKRINFESSGNLSATLSKGIDLRGYNRGKYSLNLTFEYDSASCSSPPYHFKAFSSTDGYIDSIPKINGNNIIFTGFFDEMHNVIKIDVEKIGGRYPINLKNGEIKVFSSGKEVVKKFRANDAVDNIVNQTVKILISDNEFTQKPDTAGFQFINVALAPNIYCAIPKKLYKSSKGTYPYIDSNVVKKNNAILYRKETDIQLQNKNYRLGSVVVAWNVLRYAYPYWEDSSISRDSLFKSLIKIALQDTSYKEFAKSISKILSNLNDGHIGVSYSGKDQDKLKSLPLDLIMIDDKIRIRKILDSSLNDVFSEGSIIDSINGVSAMEVYKDRYSYISGSPQWRNFKSLLHLLDSTKDSVELVLSENKTRKIRLPLSWPSVEYRATSLTYKTPQNGYLKEGIYYYNLSSKCIDKFEADLPNLVRAKSIIFDLRGYPNEDLTKIIRHCMKCNEYNGWINIPIIEDPLSEIKKFKTSGWNLKPLSPHLNCKIMFITDASAQSFSESVLGYVQGLKLGKVLGQPTSGSNGDIQTIQLPYDIRIFFSGSKITNFDGSKHHFRGIIPDIKLEPTLKGIREGRDEILEGVIELANGADQ